MKNIFKTFGQWLILGLWIIFVLGIGYLSLKARSDTKTTTDDHPNTLYVSPNETLTAAKRNTLADRNRVYDSGRFTVGTTAAAGGATPDGTRNWYNVNHNLNTDNITVDVYVKTANFEGKATDYNQAYTTNRICYWYLAKKVDNNSYKIGLKYTWCGEYRIWIWTADTSGQYRVIVRTF